MDANNPSTLALFEQFRRLPEEEQLRFLKWIDGEESGFSLRVQLEAADAAREIATEIAARERARSAVLEENIQKSKRPKDKETVRLAKAVRFLKVEQRLSWRKVAMRVREEHPNWFPPSASIEAITKRCAKAYRRVVEGKKS